MSDTPKFEVIDRRKMKAEEEKEGGHPAPKEPEQTAASAPGEAYFDLSKPLMKMACNANPPRRTPYVQGLIDPGQLHLTAAAQRVRTARCKGATPSLSRALGSAPASIRQAIVAACADGFQASEPGRPTAA